jgi:hypothetical protein
MSEEKRQIWYHIAEAMTVFYSIPENVFFLPGEYRLERFDGVVKTVQPEELVNYRVEENEAEQQLKLAYEEALNVVKKKLNYMARFAEITGKTARFDKLVSDAADPGGVANVQEFVQDFFSKMHTTASSDVEQQNLFKETFRKVPEIAAFFDEKTLEKAAKDPEAWANEMYRTMFGEEEIERKKKKRETLKTTISEQLRKNLEEAKKSVENESDLNN